MMAKASKSMNHGPWEGHANEKRFMDALTNFMNESWSVVCQVRERSGLSSQYQMSSTEIAKRIDDISKKLECKYKEVQALEEQKAMLLTKAPAGPSPRSGPFEAPGPRQQQPPANLQTRPGQQGPPRSYAMPSSGSGYLLPPTAASGAGPSGASPRRRMQFTGSSCPPSCQEYAERM